MNHPTRLAPAVRRALRIAALAAVAGTALPAPVLAADSLGEIVVTARKRAESLQDVPMAVSAIDGAAIEAQGIQDVTQVYSRVPNLYFTTAGGASPNSDYAYLTIRGVGFNGGLEPAVGVFVDGMYVPQLGFDTAFLDVERIEVLRGPQGTLFGRNTQGGALNIVSKKPGREFGGRVDVEAGRFDTYRVQARVDGPLSDTLSGGINLQYGYSAGFAKNVTLGVDANNYRAVIGRGTLVWTPSDAITGTLIVDVTDKDLRELGTGIPQACECYDATADQIGPLGYKKTNGVQFNLDWRISDSLTFTSITGRRQVKTRSTYDWDGGPSDLTPLTLSAVTQTNNDPANPVPLTVAPNPITVSGAFQIQSLDQKFISQEFRLAGNHGERIEWLAGAYYFDQKMDQPRRVDIGPGIPFVPLYIREAFNEDRDGWAGFGQLTFRPIDRLEVTVGSRYSKENVKTGGQRVINIADAAIRAFLKNDRTDASNVSSMASVSWKLSPEVLVYATWAQGWKAGGVNRYPSRANGVVPYKDEKSSNYDVGLKANWIDGKLRTNLSFFHIDIKQQQVLNVVPDPNGLTPITVIANAAKSTSEGVEAEIDAQITDRFNVGIALGYTNATFDEFLQFGVDRSGDRFWFVPKTTSSVTLDYTLPIANGAELGFGANWRYIGDYGVPDGNLNAAIGAEIRNPAYDRVDLRARLKLQSGWEFTAYVRNVFDSYDTTQIIRDAFAPTFTPQNTYVTPLEPRVYGVIASKRF